MNDILKPKILLESGTNEFELMEFTVGDNRFGINVAKILEIMQYSPVNTMPNSNPYVEGIFKPRENIMTVINLASYLGLEPTEDPSRDIFIITIFNSVYTAFHVHSVEEIHRISWEAIEKPDTTIYSGDEGLATGIARLGSKLVTILDFEKILADISPDKSIQISSLDSLGERLRSDRPILLAEDSPLLEKLLIECLNRSEYMNLTMCSDGVNAWETLKSYTEYEGPIEDKVACIITDLEMPRMDGHKLLKSIRSDPRLSHIPVIIFSSLINDEMRVKGNQLGATAQITKPEIANLVKLIDTHIL